ncbi:glycosyltransferase family 32 protein [Metabacillus idriensis]|uniref:glycosyltransferase family 32 protein n=1 Tax=Metabacillus idriensis TaxID=324768 RepID=UPI00174DE7E4|nr:capsular polysaccharide synthesis protein [Metabacillus idriensis]
MERDEIIIDAPIIPKVIHYCWFGKKDKPAIIKKCIQSWRKKLVGYEIIEWNEDNFDIQFISYVKEAYDAGKYAFVSDYVRVYALYHHGGIYLDTDVEVFKPFDDEMLCHESFWGFEQENFIATSTIGAVKGNRFIKNFLDSYENKRFLKEDGSYDSLTNVAVVTKLLESKKLMLNGEYQVIKGIGAFYPQTYFSPYDYINSRKFISENTFTIHYFYKSWLPLRAKVKGYIKFSAARIIGGNNIAKLRKIFS